MHKLHHNWWKWRTCWLYQMTQDTNFTQQRWNKPTMNWSRYIRLCSLQIHQTALIKTVILTFNRPPSTCQRAGQRPSWLFWRSASCRHISATHASPVASIMFNVIIHLRRKFTYWGTLSQICVTASVSSVDATSWKASICVMSPVCSGLKESWPTRWRRRICFSKWKSKSTHLTGLWI